jgi:hypothetical protein
MMLTRRDFIESIGIAVASLVMAGCIPSGGQDDSPQGRLRSCWLRLDWLARQAREDYERGEQARDELVANHRAALDDLVAAGEVDAAVADQVQVAFDEAAFHAWRSNAPMTCYMALPVEYGGRDDLLQQAELLRKTASGLDPAVVEEVQAAIARDIALFEAAAGPEAGAKLIEQFETGEIKASPEAVEAARILVDLLLRRTE